MPFRRGISAHIVLNIKTSLPKRTVQMIFLAVQEDAGTSSAFFGYSLKIGLDGHLILQGARTAEPKSFLGADGCSLHQTSVVLKLVFIFHLHYRKCLENYYSLSKKSLQTLHQSSVLVWGNLKPASKFFFQSSLSFWNSVYSLKTLQTTIMQKRG